MQWTEEQIGLLRKWYGKISSAELAAKLGANAVAIRLKASRLGLSRKIDTHGFKWTDEKVEFLKQRYETDEIAVLCKEIGASMGTIRNKAVSLGLHSNVGKVRAGRERSARNSSVDIHYFDQWSPNMAYILGFLFADGSISKRGCDVVIAVASKDEAVLHFIKDETKSTRKLYIQKAKVDKEGYQHNQASFLYLSSLLLVKRLQKLGMQQRKTYTDEPYPLIPDHLFPHFLRGYFDGDGMVFTYRDKRWPTSQRCRMGFIGSPRFMEGLRDTIIRLISMTYREVKQETYKTTCARLIWNTPDDIRRFHDFVYPPGYSFCLERKRQVLVDWLASKSEQS